MKQLFSLTGAVRRHPAVGRWLDERPADLAGLAKRWFDEIRGAGDDVTEVLHDGHPTASVDGVAFAYVNVFRAHVNVCFFRGAELPDPVGLLEGTGRFMRHVKVRPVEQPGAAAQKPAYQYL